MGGQDSDGEDSPRRRVRFAGVVPEKRALGRQVQGAFQSLFWDQQSSSSASIPGTLPTTPSAAPPTPLLSPSGVSRVQFIIANQAIGLPFMPGYDAEQGGVVSHSTHSHAAAPCTRASQSRSSAVNQRLHPSVKGVSAACQTQTHISRAPPPLAAASVSRCWTAWSRTQAARRGGPRWGCVSRRSSYTPSEKRW